jgi:hypothetical protein
VTASSSSSDSDPALEDLERRRDRSFRRLPSLRVTGQTSALRFLQDVGLASLFAVRGQNLPCLWVAVCGRRDPQFPHHSHHDPEVGLAWRLKDELPAAGKVFYAKLIHGKPTFVSWNVFPAVYRLFGPRRDYLAEYRAGLLSSEARAILDALHRKRPQETLELKLNTGLVRPAQRRVFDAAMAELQRRLCVCMREVRYEPAFTYVWDLVEARFPERIAPARALREREAAKELCRRYLESVVYASPAQIAAVAGGRAGADFALRQLARAGEVKLDARIDGLAGKWVLWTGPPRR